MTIPTISETDFGNITHSQEENLRNKRYTDLRRRIEKKQEQLEFKRKYGFNDDDWNWDE